MSRNQEIMKFDIERQIGIEIRLRCYKTINILKQKLLKTITINIPRIYQ